MQEENTAHAVELLLTYEESYQKLAPEQQEICRQLMARVDGWLEHHRGEGTSRRADAIAAALRGLAADPVALQLVDRLTGPASAPSSPIQNVSNIGKGSTVITVGRDLSGTIYPQVPPPAAGQTSRGNTERVKPAPETPEPRVAPVIRPASSRGGPPFVDLEIQTRRIQVDHQTALRFTLRSPSGAARLFEKTYDSPPIHEPRAFMAELLGELEKFNRGLDAGDEHVLRDEIAGSLRAIGQNLYERLFPEELRATYRRFRDSVKSMLVVSDEEWIPWELIGPFEEAGDDFFCVQFQLGRWLTGDAVPKSEIAVARAAGISGDDSLPLAAEELRDLKTLCDTRGVVFANHAGARFSEVQTLLERGGTDLLHFASHGDHLEADPDASKIDLVDRPFRARDLIGEMRSSIRGDRPLVVLNACRAARQAPVLTGLGGWANAWVGKCHCGGLVAPQWAIRDSRGQAFSKAFYRHLTEGHSLGEAVRLTRIDMRTECPGDPAWLAYSLFGDPGARVVFGA